MNLLKLALNVVRVAKWTFVGLLFLVPFVTVYAVGFVDIQPRTKPEACHKKAQTYVTNMSQSYDLKVYMDKQTLETIQTNMYGMCMLEE